MRRIAAAFVCTALAACQSADNIRAPASLPDSVAITAPGPDVPKEIAAFSGVWAGAWQGTADGKIAVISITPEGTARVIYAWSEAKRLKPGHADLSATIAGGVMTLKEVKNQTAISFAMQPDGTLLGSYVRPGRNDHGTFYRQ